MPSLTAPQATKAGRLREQLSDRTRPVVAAGAHDALSAKLIKEAGFDAVWVSSFGVSAAQKCQPDANVLTMTEMLEVAKNVEAAVTIPVIADCDTGYGDAINVMRTAAEFEQTGVAGISLEDNPFPKRCSLYPGAKPDLASIGEMVGRIKAAKTAQRTPDFMVIARTEALIAGLGLEEAERRATAYAQAGADAILVHSKAGSADEVMAFAKRWQRPIPLVVVPTMFPQATVSELHQSGFQLIIFANHALRASIRAMGESLGALRSQGTAIAVTPSIAPLEEVYRLVGLDQLHAREQQFLPQQTSRARAIILAAGFEAQLMPLVEDRPKAMLDIKGKSILERQLDILRTCGITDIAVVRGYKKERMTLPGVRYVENERYRERYILSSLFCARHELEGPIVFLYGDILFDRSVLEKLLASQADINLVVDRAWYDQYRLDRHSPEDTELVLTKEPPITSRRFLPQASPSHILRIGQRVDKEQASGEFIGLGLLSTQGTALATSVYEELCRHDRGQPFQEAPSLSKASIADLIQELIDRGHPVASIDIYKGWLEVDTFEDYRRAWARL